MKNVACIANLQKLATRKVPRAFFDYVCAGSYEEETLRANIDDLRKLKLRQRVLVDMSSRELSTTILDRKTPLPIALAPVLRNGKKTRPSSCWPTSCMCSTFEPLIA